MGKLLILLLGGFGVWVAVAALQDAPKLPSGTPAPQAARAPMPHERVDLDVRNLQKIGIVAQSDFVLKNNGDKAVKDIGVRCRFLGRSGSVIHTHDLTIYEVVGPKATKTVRKITIGIVNEQATNARCSVLWAAAG